MPKKLCAGNLVEIRPAAEILATLDENGCLEGLPFMPEMIRYIGGRYKVSKRAHKTCDTVHQTGGRRLADCVHLEDLRCDGANHGGCGATCLIFWKTAWLSCVQNGEPRNPGEAEQSGDSIAALESLSQSAARSERRPSGHDVYRCQATSLYDATKKLRWYDLRQYVEDLTSGNVQIRHMLRVWLFHGLHKLMGLGVGYRLWRGLYNTLQIRAGRYRYPFGQGGIRDGEKTPAHVLNLRPGERVRVRSHEEILATLDRENKNRGMRFDPEMVPYCGEIHTVRRRVDRIIHETTGRMIEIRSPSVILDDVVCRSEMSQCRLFCPRAIPSYWREIWLERLDASHPSSIQGQSPPT